MRHIAKSTLRSRRRALALTGTFAACLVVATQSSAGDADYGEYLSGQCTTCHQLSGVNKGIPGIVGWPADSFIAVMNAYKNKERENKAMQTVAASLAEDEIAALAAYFATLTPKN